MTVVPPAPDTPPPLRVLFAEASQKDCDRLLTALKGGGHTVYSRQVMTLPGLREALEERWDVVLLGVGQDELEAGEAIDLVRGLDARLPIILVVDRNQPQLPVELLEGGAQDFVFKSNPARLLPVIERECAKALLARDNERPELDQESPLKESEARFLQLAGNMPECYWVVDAQTQRVSYVSPGYEQVWGRYVEALYSDYQDWLKHVHPEDRAQMAGAMARYRLGGLDERFRVIRPDGSIRWLHARNFPIFDQEGQIKSVGGVASDITSFVAEQWQVAHLAHFDYLTALPNQLMLYEQARALLSLSRRRSMGLGLMVVDIDNFSSFNETLGHTAGDELLRQVAGRLSGSLRESDILGRLGGDVFAAVLAELSEETQATVVARRVMDTLALPMRVDGQDVFVSASIGIAFFPQDGETVHELVSHAQLALRHAKESGRNNFQFYAPTMYQEVRERLFLETDLRNAVLREEFTLYYQPKVSCVTGRITGVEALARWRHPRRGLVPPDQFIPLLEETGLIVAVGRWVLREAASQLVRWQAEGFDLPSVSVNLSIRQLQSDSLLADVADALRQTGLKPGCLDLEITETMLMQNAELAINTLHSLKRLGVTVSLDDFGTGYSSLSYLKRFPLDAVKVDRSFVQDITADNDDASITRAVITMAHHLKLKVVAEGVETAGQLALLIAHHCDSIQGYYFAPPLSPTALHGLLSEGRHLPAHQLRSETRLPMALLAGVGEGAAVAAALENQGQRAVAVEDDATARAWLADNVADVLVCGTPHRQFDAIGLLQSAAERQPDCERLLLVDDAHWRVMAARSVDGTVHRLLRQPVAVDDLRRIVEGALQRRRMSDDYGRLSDEARQAEQQLIKLEEERRRLQAENHSLLESERRGYAILQNIMQELPWPVIGVDNEGLLALLNDAAQQAFDDLGLVVGLPLNQWLPDLPGDNESKVITVGEKAYRAWWREIGIDGVSQGRLLLLQGEGS